MSNQAYQFSKRKVFRMLNTLAEEERDSIRGWLKLELGKKKTEILILFDSLRAKESIRDVWPKIYPGQSLPDKPFFDNRFRKLEFELTALLEKYISIQEFLGDANLQKICLAKALNKRSQQDLFPQTYRRVLKKLKKAQVKDANYFHTLFELQRVWLYYELKHPDIKKRLALFQEWNDVFDSWWLHEKLRLGLLNINQGQIHANLEVSTHLLDEAVHLSRLEPAFDLPTIKIYNQLLDLYQNERIDDLNAEQFVKNLGMYFQEKEKQDLYGTLINFLILKTTSKEKRFLYKRLELYRSGIEEGLYLQDGFLPSAVYTNLIMLGARISKDTSLVWQDLERFKGKLSEEELEETYFFSRGILCFYDHKYAEAIRLLSLRFAKLHYEILGQAFVLQSRYELGQRTEIERGVRTFKRFVKSRKELSPERKKAYINFVSIVQKLVKAYSIEDFKRIKMEIKKLKPLGSEAWLLEKVEESIVE